MVSSRRIHSIFRRKTIAKISLRSHTHSRILPPLLPSSIHHYIQHHTYADTHTHTHKRIGHATPASWRMQRHDAKISNLNILKCSKYERKHVQNYYAILLRTRLQIELCCCVAYKSMAVSFAESRNAYLNELVWYMRNKQRAILFHWRWLHNAHFRRGTTSL